MKALAHPAEQTLPGFPFPSEEPVDGPVLFLFVARCQLAEITCQSCGLVGHVREELLTSGPHYGKYVCIECGGFAGFMRKPKNETKRQKNKYTAADLGMNRCQMCQRPREMLGQGESLEVHHVEEIGRGGEDVPENIWCVCTACHRLIHHNRTYMYDHQVGRITSARLAELMVEHRVPESVRGIMHRWLEETHEQG